MTTTATERKPANVHLEVTFERTLTQQQTVTVPVSVALDEATQQTVASQLAATRLKPRSWTITEETEPKEIEA